MISIKIIHLLIFLSINGLGVFYIITVICEKPKWNWKDYLFIAGWILALVILTYHPAKFAPTKPMEAERIKQNK